MRRKRTFTAKMFGLLAVGALAFATSCTKDLEERIDALEDKVSTLVTDVDALNTELTTISSSFNSELLTKINNSFTTLTELQKDVDASAEDLAAAKSELDSYKAEMAEFVGIQGITTNENGELVISYKENGAEKSLTYAAPKGEAGTQVSVEENDYSYILKVGEEEYTIFKAFEDNVTGITSFSTGYVQYVNLVRGAEVKGYFTLNTFDGKAPNGNLDPTDFAIYTDAVTKGAPALNGLVTVTSAEYDETNGCTVIGFTQNANSSASAIDVEGAVDDFMGSFDCSISNVANAALDAVKAAYLQYKNVNMKSEAFMFGQAGAAKVGEIAWDMLEYNTEDLGYNPYREGNKDNDGNILNDGVEDYNVKGDSGYSYKGIEVFVNANNYDGDSAVNNGLFEVLADSKPLTVNIALRPAEPYSSLEDDTTAPATTKGSILGNLEDNLAEYSATNFYTGGVDALADYSVEAYLIGCDEGQPDLASAAEEAAKVFDKAKGGAAATVDIKEPILEDAKAAAAFDAAIAGNLAQDAVADRGTKHLFANVSDMVSVKPSATEKGQLEVSIDPTKIEITGQQYFYIVVKATTKGGKEVSYKNGEKTYTDVDAQHIRLGHVIGFDAVGSLATTYAPKCEAPKFNPDYKWGDSGVDVAPDASGSGASVNDVYVHEKIYDLATQDAMYGAAANKIDGFVASYLTYDRDATDPKFAAGENTNDVLAGQIDETEYAVKFVSLDADGEVANTEGFKVSMYTDQEHYTRFTVDVPANTEDGLYTGYVTLKYTDAEGVTKSFKYELTVEMARPSAYKVVDVTKYPELYGYSVEGKNIVFDSQDYFKKAVATGFIEQAPAIDSTTGSDKLFSVKAKNTEMFKKLANLFMYDNENDGWAPEEGVKDVYDYREDSANGLINPDMNVDVEVILSTAGTVVTSTGNGNVKLASQKPYDYIPTIAANIGTFDNANALFGDTEVKAKGAEDAPSTYDTDFASVDVADQTAKQDAKKAIKYNTPYNVSLVYTYNDGTKKLVHTDYTMTYKVGDVFQSFVKHPSGSTSVDDLGWTLDFNKDIEEVIDLSYATSTQKPFYFSTAKAGTEKAPVMVWFDENVDQVNPWEINVQNISYSVAKLTFAAEHGANNVDQIEIYREDEVVGKDDNGDDIVATGWYAADADDVKAGGLLENGVSFVKLKNDAIYGSNRNQIDSYLSRTKSFDVPTDVNGGVKYRIKAGGQVTQDVTVKVKDIWNREVSKTVKVTIKGADAK